MGRKTRSPRHVSALEVNSADAKGRTALHVAAANDDVDGVCRLVEWGADVNIKDWRDWRDEDPSFLGTESRGLGVVGVVVVQ